MPFGDYCDFLAMAILNRSNMNQLIDRITTSNDEIISYSIIDNSISSINQLQKRLADTSASIDLSSMCWEYFAGYSFNHPCSALINVLYKSIWVNCLNQDPGGFKPLLIESFAKSFHLPIPRFVFDSISSHHPLTESNMTRQCQSHELYRVDLLKSIAYLTDNTWIVDANTSHPKYKLANQFLDSL